MSDVQTDDLFEGFEANLAKPKTLSASELKDLIFKKLDLNPTEEPAAIEGFSLGDPMVSEKEAKNVSETADAFAAVMDNTLKEAEKEPEEEDDIEEEAEETETKKTEPPIEPKVEGPKRFVFTEEELTIAVHGLIKKSGFSKTYIVLKGALEVVLVPPNDLANSALNLYFGYYQLKGERRTKITHIDSYVDNKTKQTIPGGRTEEETYINPDMTRAMSRATMATYVHSIGLDIMPALDKNNPLAGLEERIAILETYSSFVLDAINDKALIPFIQLLEEASKQLLNF